MADIASKIFQTIKEREPLHGKYCNEIASNLNVKQSTFYQILRAMRACGMIRKENGYWKISGEFLTHLENLIVQYENSSNFKSIFRR